ncbi:MAG: hypothetical protein OXG87_21875 [Gemmatimonadetes bacterium]|nr:hypothetical protein [Gemmatimonadota bacterium]
MTSQLTRDFIRCFQKLPDRVKVIARKNYKLWKENIAHPSLEFKRVHPTQAIYSVRIGMGWRALGIVVDNVILWFWIGPHSEYDTLVRNF